MQLLKPYWVNHDDGQAIFSVDIHPDGTRFATGGQGQGQDASGRVVIWNMKPILSKKHEEDPNCPKLLCQLDQHLGCVNCVRWSHSGRYLASAGDDKVIIIWQLSNYGGGSVFGSNVVNVEWWRCVSNLRGHDGDILDVSWSPQDTFLASVSVDNTAIIWNAAKWPERLKILRGHHGLVKGVTWDPVGRYLATQADDKTLIVWRTSDWSQETVITKPFQACGGTTSVLRLSWSPDGQYLVSAHAVNNGGPTAQIIDRDHWTTDKDFVGHRKPITCVRFNPNILKKCMGGSSKSVQYCCVAVGSRDRSLSIWFTSLKRPLLVIHDVFEDSVLDLSFSSCGRHLVAVSKDGTVAVISFSLNEMGIALTKEETDTVYMKLYGQCSSSSSTLQVTPAAIIDNPELLKARQLAKSQREEQQVNNSETGGGGGPSPNTSLLQRGPDKQIERRTADGRRRITPVFIPPSADGAGMKSFDSFSTSRTEKSKIVIEKLDGVVEPNVTPKKRPQSGSASNTNSSPAKQDVSPSSASARPETGTSTPAAAPKTNGPSLPELDGVNPGLTARLERSETAVVSSSVDTPTLSTLPVKRKLDEAQPIMVKRKRGRPPLDRSLQQQQQQAAAVSTATAPPTPAPTITAPSLVARTTATPAPAISSAVTPAVSAAPLFATPVTHVLPESSIGKTHKCQDNNGGVILVENEWRGLTSASSGGSAVHRVSRVWEGAVQWSYYTTARVTAAAVGHSCLVITAADSSLALISVKTGGQLVPSVQLPGKCAKLSVYKDFLILLTTTARVIYWNMASRTRLLDECVRHLVEGRLGNDGVRSIHLIETEEQIKDKDSNSKDTAAQQMDTSNSSSLCNGHGEAPAPTSNPQKSISNGNIPQNDAIVSASKTSESEGHKKTTMDQKDDCNTQHCIPVLVLGSGEIFARCRDLQCWLLLGEDAGVRRLVLSEYCSILPSTSAASEPPLAKLMHHTTAYSGSGRSMAESCSSTELRSALTESFIKKMLTCSAYLASAPDYRFWYSRLVTFYIKQGQERELRRVFEELMSPASSSSEGPVTTVLPSHRHFLGDNMTALVKGYLQELLLLDTGGRLQRLYTEFRELVDSPLTSSDILI